MDDNVIDEWRQIRDLIFQSLRNAEKYLKCDVSKVANNMFEMRFTNKRRNIRIYCQEVRTSKTRYIILCELFDKKSTDIPKSVKNRIEGYSKRNYEIK